MQLLGVPEALRAPLQRQVDAMSPFIPGVRSDGTSHYFAVAAAAALLQQTWRDGLAEEAAAGRAFVAAVARGELLIDEALAQATLLLFGNSYTTLDALTGLIARLIERPEIWRAAGNGSIPVPDLIEEALRLGPPTHLVLYRQAGAEIRCPSFTIPAGAAITIPLDQVNRDPGVFEQADEFLPGRSGPPHLAFGAGRHTCVGLHLARAVLRIGLEALLRQLPEWPSETRRSTAPSLLGGESITHLRIPRRALAGC
jgi:cytochrome P450